MAAPVDAVVLDVEPEAHRRSSARMFGVALVVLITVVAVALRLYRLRGGYAHGVVGYDDGVYFGSSLELVHGRLPYRDFVLVHPPGITVLMAPLAWLSTVIGTAQAMGLAKVATALAGAASAPLVAKLVWHRGGRPRCSRLRSRRSRSTR